ncbi:MAG: EAL domain-containing protein [Acidimicrobiia bacterium]
MPDGAGAPEEAGDGAFHPLLVRQLTRHGLHPDAIPDKGAWIHLLERVSTAYRDADESRYLLERAMEISSVEMANLYERLREASESRLRRERDRLRTVTDHSPVAILELDTDGRVQYANPRADDLAGRSLLDTDRSLLFWVHRDDRRPLLKRIGQAMEHSGDFDLTIRFRAADGPLRWLRLHGRALAGSGDQPDNLFIAATDVTTEVEAWEVSDRFNALLETTSDVVAVFQPDGALFHLNPVAAEFLGVPAEGDPSGHRIEEFLDERSRALLRDQAMVGARRDGTWRGEATFVDTHGRRHAMSLVVVAHVGREPGGDHYSAIARDITELKAAEQALVEQATHDGLTGLPNRVLLLDRLRHALEGARRRDSGLAVLYIDLDRFKVVNDSQGHVAGDRLLVKAAQRLRETVRAGDTVARIGGDEFVVLCEDIGDPSQVPATARRIVEAFLRPFEVSGEDAFVTASVGVATNLSAHDTAESLLRDADVAMYRAKDAGRSRLEVFDEDMRSWITERYDMEAALRQAVDNEELWVAYQPSLDLVTGEWSIVEALARWDRAEHGAVPPGRFIPLAEETGLIGALGELIMRKACTQLAHWNWARRGREPVSVAVNVSGRQLTQPGLVEMITDVLEETNAQASWLVLEVTESALVEDPAPVREHLRELSALGIRIAIDDFGTGYSGLSYLQQFPFDLVKVDRRFVDGLGPGPDSDPTDHAIVESVISLAHQLGYDVVAEGVENAAQLAALTELGCDLAQGFHLAHPVPADELERTLSGEADPRPGIPGSPRGLDGLAPGDGGVPPGDSDAPGHDGEAAGS